MSPAINSLLRSASYSLKCLSWSRPSLFCHEGNCDWVKEIEYALAVCKCVHFCPLMLYDTNKNNNNVGGEGN